MIVHFGKKFILNYHYHQVHWTFFLIMNWTDPWFWTQFSLKNNPDYFHFSSFALEPIKFIQKVLDNKLARFNALFEPPWSTWWISLINQSYRFDFQWYQSFNTTSYIKLTRKKSLSANKKFIKRILTWKDKIPLCAIFLEVDFEEVIKILTMWTSFKV